MARKPTPSQAVVLTLLLSAFAILVRLDGSHRRLSRYARRRWKPKPLTKVLIRSGGIPREGFGSAISFIKDAASVAHVLGADVRIAQSDPVFGYRTSDLIHADHLDTPGRICDLHQTVLTDLSHGTFLERHARAADELQLFTDRVEDFCLLNATEPAAAFELPAYMRQRLDQCDIIIWADQIHHTRIGWNACNLAWLRRALDVPARGSKKRTVGVHYRWGDVWHHEHLDPKWSFDQRQVEQVLATIRACDASYDAKVYMQAGRPGETEAERLAQLTPIRSFDKVIDSGDDIADLLDLASRDVLIVNSGMYSEVAAAISSARLVLHNGFFPHFFDYLRKDGTTVMTIEAAAKMPDLCHLLQDLDTKL